MLSQRSLCDQREANIWRRNVFVVVEDFTPECRQGEIERLCLICVGFVCPGSVCVGDLS